jgi:probable F420-dependent oxidoreductase
MKFGLTAPYQMGPVEDGEYAARFAKLAEELGFESIWVVEHVVMCEEYESKYPYDPSGRSPFAAEVTQPDPLIWLSYIAAATTTIRLATGVMIVPQRNALILAKELATLDRISGGRMMLGTGVGWVREESEAVGTSFDDRGERCDEIISAMRALWAANAVSSFSGKHHSFDGVVSKPKPLQSGGVPIIVGGHSKAAARRAGRLGDGFYPLGVSPDRYRELRSVMDEAAKAAGRDPAAIEITLSGNFEPATAELYAGLGADRMVVFPPTGNLDKLPQKLESFRRDVMERFA